MLDLYDELKLLVEELEGNATEYALCGGLAMAVYSIPRATIDIDLLIARDVLDSVRSSGEKLGYEWHDKAMNFKGGSIQIFRMTKPDPDSEDLLILDLIIASESLHEVWTTRQTVAWENGSLSVVSRNGLIAMKKLRGSNRDQDDISLLTQGLTDGS